MAAWLNGSGDELMLRGLFAAALAATLLVLAQDYQDFAAHRASALPAASPTGSPTQDGAQRRGMTFDLVDGGKLIARGEITIGTAARFAEEIGKRGSYIKTVVLQSPGGSVRDALSMGTLIREKKFATEVPAGEVCASSCPLVFAGGVERRAGAKAEIGVHRVVAAGERTLTQDEAMDDAQNITAVIEAYLQRMGIDLGVWTHAMATPHARLYNFSPVELVELKLATEAAGAKTVKSSEKKRS